MSKKKKTPNPFAGVDGLDGCAFTTVSDTQVLSPAYRKLSDKAKTLLIVCKLCRKYHRGEDKNEKPRTIKGNILYFYFNRKLAEQYGFKNPNVTRAALVELVRYGFIDVIENNAHRHIRNIYAYCSKWQQYNGQDIELSNAARTFVQGKT